MTEANTFNKEKFREVLHYIISRTGDEENVGKTVLFKILYFSDFDFYELNEKPITGEVYKKITHGPAPIHFDEVVEELIKDKKVEKITKSVKGFKDNLMKYISLVKPSLSLLNIDEKTQIDKIIQRLTAMDGARQVSSYSHGDMPWKATEDMEEIDYEFVFYRDGVYSVRTEEPAVAAA